MKFEQIFYGRGDQGYDILGSSVPRCGLTDVVEDLCRDVGTPGVERAEDEVPFLLQKVVGDSVVMICGRTGKTDSLGRRTLFFHALAVDRAEMGKKTFSALDCFRCNLFASSLPDGPVGPLEAEINTNLSEPMASQLHLPAVVRCRRAGNIEALKQIRAELSRINWASFSWTPLTGFDYQAIDETIGMAALKSRFYVYDKMGDLMSEPDMKGSCAAGGERHTNEAVSLRVVTQGRAVLFVLGCLLGLAVGVFAGRFMPAGSGRPDLEPSLQGSTKPPAFDEVHWITDFDGEIKKICMPRHQTGTFVGNLRYYVDFVNKNFVVKKMEGER